MARSPLRADDVSWLPALLVVNAPRRENDKRFLRTQDEATQCFFAWLLQPKVTHCGILTVRSNHDGSQPVVHCAPFKMAAVGILNGL